MIVKVVGANIDNREAPESNILYVRFEELDM